MRDRAFLLVATLALAAVAGVYSNHFHNAFHFDDFHTITANPFVHDIRNLPRFFSDSRTLSILPDHDSYRPLLVVSLAIDWWLGKGDPLWFHISTFFWYLVQLVLMYFLFAALMEQAAPDPRNRWFALFGAALYGMHPASAETVNYIIQRGDIYDTLAVIAALVVYIRFPTLRRTGLYLLPAVLGIFSKPPAAIFPAILFAYILLFEKGSTAAGAAKKSLPAVAVCLASLAISAHMQSPAFSGGGPDPTLYRLTQFYITWHYFGSFFLPVGLSADSDFRLASGWADPRVLFGIAFVVALCVAAWLAARAPKTRPIAFGIAWFLLALVPVGAMPLAELENDHRMFFPFVGLALAAVWTVRLFGATEPRALALPAMLILAACGYGTWQRNEVWHTEETLWRDVTEKSPANGRGFMNYGLTQMSRGDYNAALASFQKALPLTPSYSLLHINIGIADGALGRDAEAEQHFSQALLLAPGDSQSYYYYARWLSQRGRIPQAIVLLETGVQKNPLDMDSRKLLLNLYASQRESAKLEPLLADSLRIAPGDPDLLRFRATPAPPAPGATVPTPEAFLSLSLADYQAGRYQDCIDAARQALRLNPNYAEAYNNIAAALNALSRYDEAIPAAEQAIRLKPDFPLARNNLAWARSQKARTSPR